jgi:hypothetical protein
VSRQHEVEHQNYYGYPGYWGPTGLGGPGMLPGALSSRSHADERPLHGATSIQPADDVHLRSVNELRTYHIEGTDGSIGHVDDFIVDDATWRLPYLVVDTSNWWVGQKVLVAPQWASRVSWSESKVYIDMTRDVIKSSPRWDPAATIHRAYEARLYDFYGRPVYWDGPTSPQAARSPVPSPGHP